MGPDNKIQPSYALLVRTEIESVISLQLACNPPACRYRPTETGQALLSDYAVPEGIIGAGSDGIFNSRNCYIFFTKCFTSTMVFWLDLFQAILPPS
jgi:hypothetical protein